MICKRCRKPGDFSTGHKICKRCRARRAKYLYRLNGNAEKLTRYHANAEQLSQLRRLRVYGLQHEHYLALIDAQHGCCAICQSVLTRPCVDHDHNTGQVRGLLCSDCNTGLGLFRDDPGRLTAAINYLRPAAAVVY